MALLPGQNGLFDTKDIPPGVWIASFGRCERVTGPKDTKYGYALPCRGTDLGGDRPVWVTPAAILQQDVEFVNTCGVLERNNKTGECAEIEPIVLYLRSKRLVSDDDDDDY